jgi:hypothetical protein
LCNALSRKTAMIDPSGDPRAGQGCVADVLPESTCRIGAAPLAKVADALACRRISVPDNNMSVRVPLVCAFLWVRRVDCGKPRRTAFGEAFAEFAHELGLIFWLKLMWQRDHELCYNTCVLSVLLLLGIEPSAGGIVGLADLRNRHACSQDGTRG